jgi:putative ABC transport system permease protein
VNLLSDVRYGIRTLRASPGFAATAVLTLALGIGATTATFSVSDAMLWKPVPLPHLESLVMLLQRVPGEPNDWNNATPADTDDIVRQSKSLASVSSWQDGMANIGGSGGEAQRVLQALVSANFFDVMGVQPARGRGFQPGEDQPGREREVILSDRFWQRAFGADPSVIGRAILVDDQSYVVTGVMPASFDFPLATEIWTPLALTAAQRGSRANQNLVSTARLKPGHTIELASAELDAIGRRLESLYPNTNHNRRFMFWPITRFLVDGDTRQYVLLLLGAVIFVLLIACVNVANLQFARATGRLREVAIRTALGASRGRVMVQLVTESVLLSLAGAAAGLLVAKWGLNLIRGNMPPEVARYIVGWQDMKLDGRTLAFTAAAAVASGILAGLAPAWQCSRPNLSDALKEGGRGGTVGRARHLLRNVLVAAEIALAVELLVGAGLMVRGFRSQIGSGRQFEPASVLTLRMAITDNKYHEPFRRAAFYRDVEDRVNALPGVQSAAVATAMPYSNHHSSRYITIEGLPVERGDQPLAMYQSVSPKFFSTLHVPLRAGRLPTDGDGADAPLVVVVNERFAQKYWKGQSPLGQRFKLGMPDSKSPWLTVVGVVGNIPHNPYDRDFRHMMFVPYQQAPQLWMDLGVRTAGDPLRLAPAVLSAIRAVDPEVPASDVRTLEKSIHNSAIGLNYVAAMMGVFGVLALALAAVGVYGVMAYLVSEQTHEIGLRMALGSSRGNVLALVFRRGLITTFIGLAAGIPVAYWLATKLVASLIYGVTASDPVTFVGIPATLIATAVLAIYIPARRAMRIDPIVALRYE